MYVLNKLPPTYLKARLRLIEQEFERLPVIHQGKHHGISVLRIYCKNGASTKQFQCRSNSKKGMELLKIKKRRDSLFTDITIFKGLLEGLPDEPRIDISKVDTIYNKDMWERIHIRAEFEEKTTGYQYKDMMMDSRGEMIVAQTLESLGLEYKYEPRIIIGDEIYYPDFIVYLPEFERCFFIEFMGRLDNDKYISRNKFKLMDYLKAGMVVNKDILLFCGYEDSMVNADDMIDDIVALIKKYCRMYSETAIAS